jgi:hypothetical protein
MDLFPIRDGFLEMLYVQALEEYRFQVTLGWDRAKHYFTYNSVILAGASSLAATAPAGITPAAKFLIASAAFLVAFVNSWAGLFSAEVNHDYYRNTRDRLALIERLLGLDRPVDGERSLAVQTTSGMQSRPRRIKNTTMVMIVNWALISASGLGLTYATVALVLALAR